MIDFDTLSLFEPPEAASPDQTALAWLLGQDVTITAIASPWSVRVARVVYLPNGGYQPVTTGDFAYLLPVIENGIVDAVAWSPALGKTATRLGLGACLGEGQIGRDGFGTTGPAIPVWRSPLAWLQAERVGVVIVDTELAAHRLAGFNLLAEDQQHARELRKVLQVRRPTILVPDHKALAA